MTVIKLHNLIKGLDRLWKAGAPDKLLAAELLEQLDQYDWLALASWDAAATFGSNSGRITYLDTSFNIDDDWGKTLFQCRLVPPDSSVDESVSIRYRDAGWSVAVELVTAPSSGFTPIVHSGTSLLIALELIRDHLDSVMLHPFEQRQRGIERMAMAADLTSDHFRRLAAWYGQIRPQFDR